MAATSVSLREAKKCWSGIVGDEFDDGVDELWLVVGCTADILLGLLVMRRTEDFDGIVWLVD